MSNKITKPRNFIRGMVNVGRHAAVAAMLINPGFTPVLAQTPVASPVEGWSYADVTDLFLAAPIVAKVRVTEAIRLPESPAATAPANRIRYYLVGDVLTLIRGSGGLAPRTAWLADVSPDARGKPPKLKKSVVK